jgi:MerR family copper efflux transcriptional regulator
MDGYTISQVAERTGFAPSALRYYEQAGLVRPTRTEGGYRTYDDHDLELLRFVGRAKGFGLSLDEIAELLGLLADECCEPVQDRLKALVDAKIADTQDRIAELLAFTAELQHVAASLSLHTPAGPCDDSCGCTTAATDRGTTTGVRLTARPDQNADAPVVCTLDPADVRGRLADWQDLAAQAEDREHIDGGVRLRFPPDIDVGAVAALTAAEQTCCRFFTFRLTIGALPSLDVIGPPDARPLVESLVGAPR